MRGVSGAIRIESHLQRVDANLRSDAAQALAEAFVKALIALDARGTPCSRACCRATLSETAATTSPLGVLVKRRAMPRRRTTARRDALLRHLEFAQFLELDFLLCKGIVEGDLAVNSVPRRWTVLLCWLHIDALQRCHRCCPVLLLALARGHCLRRLGAGLQERGLIALALQALVDLSVLAVHNLLPGFLTSSRMIVEVNWFTWEPNLLPHLVLDLGLLIWRGFCHPPPFLLDLEVVRELALAKLHGGATVQAAATPSKTVSFQTAAARSLLALVNDSCVRTGHSTATVAESYSGWLRLVKLATHAIQTVDTSCGGAGIACQQLGAD